MGGLRVDRARQLPQSRHRESLLDGRILHHAQVSAAGLGEQVAVRLFNKFDGVWEVGEIPENIEAQVFWRLIIGRYTDNHFQEVNADSDLWHGPVQTFRTP